MVFYTWITEKNGRVGRVRQNSKNTPPGPEWRLVPNDWGGRPGDDLKWFDTDSRRIPDCTLIKDKLRKDNRGKWINKKNPGETKQIYELDQSPGEDYTQEEPLKNEPYQKWDPKKNKFVIDEKMKEKAEKEQSIGEKKSAIQNAEQKKLRSLIARLEGVATEKDEEYYTQFSSEIISLRAELKELKE